MAEAYDLEVRLDAGAIKRLSRSGEVLEGLRIATFFVERESKRHAPVRTGNLRRSIYSEVEVDPIGAVGRVGTNVQYGIFQELGTRFHPAQPYLRPALEALRARLQTGRLE